MPWGAIFVLKVANDSRPLQWALGDFRRENDAVVVGDGDIASHAGLRVGHVNALVVDNPIRAELILDGAQGSNHDDDGQPSAAARVQQRGNEAVVLFQADALKP